MTEGVFHENVVIITGASSGIGRELAFQLADQDAWLSLAARDGGRLQDVATACQQRGARTLITQTDVAVREQYQTLVGCTLRAFGRIGTLVNNAGIPMWALFDQIQDLAMLERIMQVNYFGSVYCTHYALPHLK
jgi:NAD(P)-dependent dehydrogenase (short-subunit alcohol dehydrogenase family)